MRDSKRDCSGERKSKFRNACVGWFLGSVYGVVFLLRGAEERKCASRFFTSECCISFKVCFVFECYFLEGATLVEMEKGIEVYVFGLLGDHSDLTV